MGTLLYHIATAKERDMLLFKMVNDVCKEVGILFKMVNDDCKELGILFGLQD